MKEFFYGMSFILEIEKILKEDQYKHLSYFSKDNFISFLNVFFNLFFKNKIFMRYHSLNSLKDSIL